jgi:5-methyltetrahydropteroyltriglutamate--homocysteine methyltransferase
VNAQTYSFEAANVRHEHEMSVWKEVKLAPGTILMP